MEVKQRARWSEMKAGPRNSGDPFTPAPLTRVHYVWQLCVNLHLAILQTFLFIACRRELCARSATPRYSSSVSLGILPGGSRKKCVKKINSAVCARGTYTTPRKGMKLCDSRLLLNFYISKYLYNVSSWWRCGPGEPRQRARYDNPRCLAEYVTRARRVQDFAVITFAPLFFSISLSPSQSLSTLRTRDT